jgi:hypothetical protein
MVKINFNYDKIEFWCRLVKKAQQKRTKSLVEEREWYKSLILKRVRDNLEREIVERVMYT